MDKTYSKVLTIILIIIIVAILGLIGYLGYNYYRNQKISADASEFVEQAFTEEINEDEKNNDNNTLNQFGTVSGVGVGDGNNGGNSDNDPSSSSSNREKRKKYKGFYVNGTIYIPKTGCKYPILEKVTKKSLESSVAIIWPEKADLNQVGNVVIVGHNYRNGLFFSDNKKLSKGDKIYITDYNGKRVTYEIYKIFTTTDIDTSFYNRDTKGAREITLSTCTDDSSARLIVQAKEASK